ncbi:hypothetical protein DBV08_30890 [Rhodococcus sp. KBW08]|nr:hypothetical protein DBV08_30890 [Rhodococcus sp. KBW08]
MHQSKVVPISVGDRRWLSPSRYLSNTKIRASWCIESALIPVSGSVEDFSGDLNVHLQPNAALPAVEGCLPIAVE